MHVKITISSYQAKKGEEIAG